jgi:uncharacterized membrane protein
VAFEDFAPTGRILPALNSAVASGAIRLVDLQFVSKDQAGRITSLEMSGLSPAEQIEFGSVIGALIGAGVAGEEGAVAGALEGALAAAEHSYGMTAEDVQDIADSLPPGGAAALLMIEHTWAIGFRNALRDAGGQMLAQGFLTPDTLFLVGAELEAQAEALAAIEEAAEAIVLSEAIQAEAARRAVAALVAAEMIEEAALEEAAEVVAAALAIEEAALEEAEDTD